MSQKIKKLGALCLSMQFLASCSSTYKAPESFDQKMARYQAQTYSKNQTPELPSFGPLKTDRGRAPASVKPTTQDQEPTPEFNFVQSHSPKRLYFLTLYTQFKKLSQMKEAQGAKAPNVCPHFHSTLVEHNEYFKNAPEVKASAYKTYSKELIQSLKNDPKKLAYFPELALPVQTDSLRPRVIDLVDHESHVYTPLMTQKMVDEAIGVHLSKTQNELVELCEFGSSDNYYIYENLVGKIEREGGFKADSFGAQTMLKTSLIFNQALIDSLKTKSSSSASRAPASMTKGAHELYHDEALKRLEADWMRSYFSELNQD